MALAGMASSELKAKWASEHLEALQERIRDWVKNEASAPIFEDDIKAQELVVTLIADHPPADIALIAGDFLCSLRSALDHLAWALVSINGKPGRDTSFPIRGDNTVEAQIAIAKATFGMPEQAIATIRTLQPYHAGNDYRLKHLWRLHKMWNIDKHRFVTLHSTVIDWSIPINLPHPVSHERLNDRVKMRFPISAKEQMHLYPPVMRDIQFGSDEEQVLLTTTDFIEMEQYVTQGVLPFFKGFFI